jgi:hypothetical protein
VEAAESVEVGAAETTGQSGAARGPRGGLRLLSPALPTPLQLPEHSGRHIPQRHLRARLPTVGPVCPHTCFYLFSRAIYLFTGILSYIA